MWGKNKANKNIEPYFAENKTKPLKSSSTFLRIRGICRYEQGKTVHVMILLCKCHILTYCKNAVEVFPEFQHHIYFVIWLSLFYAFATDPAVYLISTSFYLILKTELGDAFKSQKIMESPHGHLTPGLRFLLE